MGAWIETDTHAKRNRPLGSHPVWVRGLKHQGYFFGCCPELSHPVWVRGLKPPISKGEPEITCVAPRVGAWIETHAAAGLSRAQTVAPRVGAWIETSVPLWTDKTLRSHPVWVRGLKPEYDKLGFESVDVAPRVGAWIETYFLSFCSK